jgi:hypothetical protein
MRTSRSILAVLAAGPMLAAACGFCEEDRIASVYDHAVVQAAAAAKREVAFFSLEGIADDTARRAITAALVSAGATKSSVRISDGACSVAFDPARTSAATIASAVNARLAPRGVKLAVLRTM